MFEKRWGIAIITLALACGLVSAGSESGVAVPRGGAAVISAERGQPGRVTIPVRPADDHRSASRVAKPACADAYTTTYAPNWNTGGLGELRVGLDHIGNLYGSLLWFDLSEIPPHSQVLSAELALYCFDRSGGRGHTRCSQACRAWNEYQVTCKSCPGCEEANTVQILVEDIGWQYWYPTAIVQQWVNGEKPNCGFLLYQLEDMWHDLHFMSRDCGNRELRPRLVVTYVVPGQRRDDLSRPDSSDGVVRHHDGLARPDSSDHSNRPEDELGREPSVPPYTGTDPLAAREVVGRRGRTPRRGPSDDACPQDDLGQRPPVPSVGVDPGSHQHDLGHGTAYPGQDGLGFVPPPAAGWGQGPGRDADEPKSTPTPRDRLSSENDAIPRRDRRPWSGDDLPDMTDRPWPDDHLPYPFPDRNHRDDSDGAAEGTDGPFLEFGDPNPFHTTTRVWFSLPNAGDVTVAVYSFDGRLVRVLFSGLAQAGRHSEAWDGCDASGRSLAPGTYYCRVNVGPGADTRKLVKVE